VISLKTECIRIYMGRAKSKLVSNPTTSVFPIGTLLLRIFKFLPTNPRFPVPENVRFPIFTVLELITTCS